MQQVAIVTGASSGIGRATVREFRSEGMFVFAGARRLESLRTLEPLGTRSVFLDLVDDASMVAAIHAVEREAGRLDVLVNNAGCGFYGALEDVPVDEARRQFEVNLFGLARLCQLALPLMRRQGHGRIINVSSIGGKFGEPFGSWYHASKYAVEGLSDSLRMEVAAFGIDVVIVEPGTIRTEWSGIASESLERWSSGSAYAPYARRHLAMLARARASSVPSPPEVVARTILRAARSARPRTRYPSGAAARPMLLLRQMLSDRMFDRMMCFLSQSVG